MMENFYNITENIKALQHNVAEICTKQSLDRNSIHIMGVSKTRNMQEIQVAIDAGITLFGENKVQELIQKEEVFKKNNVQCEMIGHLQTNKVKYLPPLTQAIQSVDSFKLATEINRQYEKAGKVVNTLIEINIGNESAKSGVCKSEALELISQIATLKSIHVQGLMCIPPVCEGDKVRHYFAQMRQLFIDMRAQNVDNVNMDILSMGMSDDYQYALLEGSNLIRIGQGIFGERVYNNI